MKTFYKNVDLKKFQNLHFSKWVSPWFCKKKLTFFQLLFLCNMDREKLIGQVLERKSSLFRLEQYLFKWAPKFSHGVSSWCLSKIEIFPCVDFMQNSCRESVWWSFRKKNKNFIDYRNVDIKSPQICIFPWFL